LIAETVLFKKAAPSCFFPNGSIARSHVYDLVDGQTDAVQRADE
jgi:hypothetical protein